MVPAGPMVVMAEGEDPNSNHSQKSAAGVTLAAGAPVAEGEDPSSNHSQKSALGATAG